MRGREEQQGTLRRVMSWQPPISEFRKRLALLHHIRHLCIHVEDVCIVDLGAAVTASVAHNLEG